MSEQLGQPRIVEKIGGAGSADETSVMANVNRMLGEENLWGVVVSGPGGEKYGRLTESTLGLVDAFMKDEDHMSRLDEIEERLEEHAEPFGQAGRQLAEDAITELRAGLYDGRGAGWAVMLPERYAMRLYGHLLEQGGRQAQMFNPTPWVRRDARGAIDLATSTRGLSRQFDGFDPNALIVMAGTPGVDQQGRVMTVTTELRGYSDAAGMAVAHALQASSDRPVIYRIIKDDVSGILRMPPGLGREPAIASRLSVVEAATLGVAGNNVVQPAVLDLLQQSDVQLQVCSGDSNGEDGTIIERHRPIEAGERIAGIALQEVVAYTVADIRMEHQTGVMADVASRLKSQGVPLLDVVTGLGVITTYVTATSHAASENRLSASFDQEYGDTFSLRGSTEADGFSIVTLVGEAMVEDLRLRAAVENDALRIGYENDIAIGASWASPNNNAVYLTVPNTQVKSYAQAAYDEFFPA